MIRLLVLTLVAVGCTARPELPAVDPGLAGLEVSELQPKLVLPGRFKALARADGRYGLSKLVELGL